MRRLFRADDGFTIIEALVAVTVLSVAIVLSIQPVMVALRGVSDARVISVGENLAQAEIEVIRSLDYDQVGLPGRTPSGSLDEERTVVIEGRSYAIYLDIDYAGSVTGLSVIPQGGDGVEGSWDPGVDYKVARVTVIANGRESDPIVMETIIAPTRVGEHEGIANAKVLVAAHEPFAASGASLPTLKIHAPPAAAITSAMASTEQVWPAIPPGAYTVLVDNPNGWIVHPQDLLDGLDQLSVVAGSTATTTLRVYRPATLELEVLDFYSHDPVTSAGLTLTNVTSGGSTAYLPGEYVIENLVPDAYGVTVSASGYFDWTLSSLNIPMNYPDPVHRMTIYLEPLVPPTTTTTTTTTTTIPGSTTTTVPGDTTTTTVPSTTTTTTLPSADRRWVEFTVVDSRSMVVAGAQVVVSHLDGGDGPFTGVSDSRGRVSFNLIDGDRYRAVGSTEWGHGSDTDDLTVGGWIDALELTRPSGKGLMTLSGGEKAEFVYRAASWQGWIAMPPNYNGQASFASYSGWFEVGKRCIANGQVVGIRDVYVSGGRNRSASISGWCPSP